MENKMLLKKEPFHGCNTPWEGDELERKQIADYLTPIIDSIRQPFVIGLNSPYGTGKTFFIQHWKKQLEIEGYKTVYFNAWETDYSEDALIAFISSIKEQLVGDKKDAEKLGELAKTGGAYLARRVMPVIAKGVASQIIGSKTVEEFIDLSEQTDEELAEFLGGVAEDSLRKHEAIKSSIENFRSYLEKLIQDLTKSIDDENRKKLIIFVDELDRCRPNYAIEVLECIKHLFSVSGVVFILAIDEEQIHSSIASVYGTRLDGEGYLKKFIDWRLNLPKPSSLKYSRYLFEKFNLFETKKLIRGRDAFRGDEDLVKSFGLLSESLSLTLRQQAQCYTEINLVIRSLHQKVYPCTFMLGAIAALRVFMPKEIKAYCLGSRSAEDLIRELEPYIQHEVFERFFMRWNDFRPWFHAWFLSQAAADELRQEKQIVQEDMNAISASRIVNDKAGPLRERYAYLGNVLSTHDSLKAQCRISCSFAESVYRNLERASYLTEAH